CYEVQLLVYVTSTTRIRYPHTINPAPAQNLSSMYVGTKSVSVKAFMAYPPRATMPKGAMNFSPPRDRINSSLYPAFSMREDPAAPYSNWLQPLMRRSAAR